MKLIMYRKRNKPHPPRGVEQLPRPNALSPQEKAYQTLQHAISKSKRLQKFPSLSTARGAGLMDELQQVPQDPSQSPHDIAARPTLHALPSFRLNCDCPQHLPDRAGRQTEVVPPCSLRLLYHLLKRTIVGSRQHGRRRSGPTLNEVDVVCNCFSFSSDEGIPLALSNARGPDFVDLLLSPRLDIWVRGLHQEDIPLDSTPQSIHQLHCPPNEPLLLQGVNELLVMGKNANPSCYKQLENRLTWYRINLTRNERHPLIR